MISSFATFFVALTFLILLSTFFSISESVFLSASEEKFHKLKADGFHQASDIIDVLKNRQQYLNASLLYNTIINVFISSLSTYALIGAQDVSPILFTFLTFSLGVVIFLFAESIPKVLGIKKANEIIVFIVPIFKVLRLFALPIILLMDNFFSFHSYKRDGEASESILGAVEMYHQQGGLESDSKAMLSSILSLNTVEVRNVMTQKSDIYAIDIDYTKDQIFNAIVNSKFKKIPIFDNRYEKVISVISVNKFFKFFYTNNIQNFDINLDKITEVPYFIPEGASLKSQLPKFKENGNNTGFVVDEYGVVIGMITLEDIIERIIGNISDENDQSYEIRDELSKFILSGDTDIKTFNEKFNTKFSEEKFSTIAGLITDKLERIPNTNEEIILDKYKIKIISMSNNRIKEIEILKDSSINNHENIE